VYTPDPELADFYVVPLLPECYVRDKLERGGVDYVTAMRKVNPSQSTPKSSGEIPRRCA
jgi:hypothetical protein